MVDRDVLKDLGKGDSSNDKKKPSPGSSSSSDESSSGEATPYELDDSERTDPGDVDITDAKDNLGDPELNYGKGTTSLRKYKKLQIEEVKELHQDMYRTAKNYSDEGLDSFILVFQAMITSYAQNRTGIAMTIQNEFGKSKKESVKIANQICRKAGEGKTFEKIASLLTERFMDS